MTVLFVQITVDKYNVVNVGVADICSLQEQIHIFTIVLLFVKKGTLVGSIKDKLST